MKNDSEYRNIDFSSTNPLTVFITLQYNNNISAKPHT